MDKNRIDGAAKINKGAIKEVAGTLFGDAKLAKEGKNEKAEGKAQNAGGQEADSAKV
jgi:uncharacterized protein YjbJ (UPF0337 family)